jgi:CheY-like chemotaxis protein
MPIRESIVPMEITHPALKRYARRYAGARAPTYLLDPLVKLLSAPAPISKSRHVLIIDDDPFFRSLLKVMLTQIGFPAVAILEAEGSRTALELYQNESVDLVFCDLNLPKEWSKDGIGIVNDIRKIRPVLPVYMVTAENNANIIEEVHSAGATGHILKPVNLRTLKRVMTATFSFSGLSSSELSTEA